MVIYGVSLWRIRYESFKSVCVASMQVPTYAVCIFYVPPTRSTVKAGSLAQVPLSAPGANVRTSTTDTGGVAGKAWYMVHRYVPS